MDSELSWELSVLLLRCSNAPCPYLLSLPTSNSLRPWSIILVSFSPNTSKGPGAQGQSEILDLFTFLLDVGQYGRLQMASNSLPSSFLRGVMLHLSWFVTGFLSTEYRGRDIHWQLLPLLQSPVVAKSQLSCWMNRAEGP